MNSKKRLILFILLSPVFAFSQNSVDIAQIDSFAKTVKYKNDLSALTNELTSPYSEQFFKARSIFKWITENIRYDYKYYNKYSFKGKEPKTYKCKDEEICEAKRIDWETKYIEKVLRKKKAVCQGYSMLFKKMCEIAGLKSELIVGYIRTEPYQVGTPGILDHAWNAVWMDSSYLLLDATWAAGFCEKTDEGKLLSFKKEYNDYYWLTPAAEFARNHFPQKDKWTLLPHYTKDNFATNPYYLPGAIQYIQLITPPTGFITAKKGDTIRFEIKYRGYIRDLQINSNIFRNPDIWVPDQISKRKKVTRLDSLALKKQQYIEYNLTGNIYEFQYIVTDNSLRYLDILFDRQRMMRFKVITEQKEQ